MQLLVIQFTIKMFHMGFMQVLVLQSLKSQYYKIFKTLQLSNLAFRGPCIVIYFYNKSQQMQYIYTLFAKQLYMFRTDLLFIIRSLNETNEMGRACGAYGGG
jgi:hypothetical protein